MAGTKCPALTFTLKGEPKKILDDAKKQAAKNDITISGNEKKGSMKHNKIGVSGTYTVSDKTLKVTMVDDTWLADCKKINAKVKEWFEGK